MKITDFKNEDALDLVADLIEPAVEIFSDEKVRDLFRNNGNKVQLAKHILKSHKKAIIEIFARLNNTPVKDYECDVITLMKDLLDVLNDKDLLAVFTLEGQKMANTSFGSVTESTEE